MNELMKILHLQMQKAVRREVRKILSAVYADCNQRRRALKNWDGTGSVPILLNQGYGIDMNSGTVWVVFEGNYSVELLKLNRVNLAYLEKALIEVGWQKVGYGLLWRS